MAYEGSGAGSFMSGFSGGMDTGKKLDTQWDENRARKAAAAAIPQPGGQPPVHQSLVDNIKGHTENFINSLIGTHFGQQPGAVGAPAAPVVAPPGATPVAIPAPGVAPPPVAMVQPQPMPVAPGMVPQPPRPMMMAHGGPVPEGYAEGGPVNYEGSGAGAAVGGFATGMDIGKGLSQQWRTKRAEDAAADALPAAQEEHKTSVAGHFENFAKHLLGMGLNDNHVRNSQQAVSTPPSGPVPSSPGPSAVPAGPSPAPPASPAQTPSAGAPSPASAPAAAGASSGAPDPTASGIPAAQQIAKASIQNAASDPAAKQGIPQKTPAQSGHSLSHVDWEQSDALMAKAIRAATRAGQDPAKVYESLNNTRLAFMQSSVLRNIGAANVALMHGDNKAAEQAIKNVNYYMPNGQDLDIQHDKATGALQVRDPFAAPGPDGQQPLVDITAQHLQLMAQNAMDPMKVQDIINAAHTQGAKIAHEQVQDQVAIQGALAKNTDANTRALLAPALIRLYGSHAYSFVTRANADAARAAHAEAAKGQVPFAVAQKAATDGSNAVFLMAQGLEDTAPVMGPDGQPSLSPAAGKQYRNADKIPEFLKGPDGKVMSPSDIAGVASLSSSISAANVGRGMSGPAAAELAGNVYKMTHAKKIPTHIENGKAEPNVKFNDPNAPTIGWIWHQGANPKEGSWQQFYIHAEAGSGLMSGTDGSVPIPDEADPTMEFPTNPADNEPAVPAPSNY